MGKMNETSQEKKIIILCRRNIRTQFSNAFLLFPKFQHFLKDAVTDARELGIKNFFFFFSFISTIWTLNILFAFPDSSSFRTYSFIFFPLPYIFHFLSGREGVSVLPRLFVPEIVLKVIRQSRGWQASKYIFFIGYAWYFEKRNRYGLFSDEKRRTRVSPFFRNIFSASEKISGCPLFAICNIDVRLTRGHNRTLFFPSKHIRCNISFLEKRERESFGFDGLCNRSSVSKNGASVSTCGESFVATRETNVLERAVPS